MSIINRDGTGPAFEKLSFDGNGINASDEFATRLLTVARQHPDDGGGYVLDFDGRRRVGTLLAAAPELAAALRGLLGAVNVKRPDPLIVFAAVEKARAVLKGAKCD